MTRVELGPTMHKEKCPPHYDIVPAPDLNNFYFYFFIWLLFSTHVVPETQSREDASTQTAPVYFKSKFDHV